MRPLTIVHVIGELNPDDLGGAEVHIVEVIRGLARRGHILHLFVGPTSRCRVLFPFENVHIHPVSARRIKNFSSFLYMHAAKRAIACFLKKHRVDLIHSKQVFPQGAIGATLHRRFKVPHYVTVQNPLAYKEELVLQLPLFSKSMNGLIQRCLRPFAIHALRYASVAACVSTYSEQRSHDLVSGVATSIVPNGVDTTQFSPSPTPPMMQDDIIRLSTTSTLIPRNGIDVLIKGFALVAKARPHVRLDIAGDGPLEKELKHLCRELEIEDRVSFLGTLTHDKVPDLLRRSHLFVRPSRAEGFGVSFVEAMACGVPVVTCPSGGIVDFVRDRETGRLVPPDNPAALAEAIVDLIDNPVLYATLQKNALKMVCERYSWESIVDKVEGLYGEILMVEN